MRSNTVASEFRQSIERPFTKGADMTWKLHTVDNTVWPPVEAWTGYDAHDDALTAASLNARPHLIVVGLETPDGNNLMDQKQIEKWCQANRYRS